MDGLTDEERLEAWHATWHPSFHATAIFKDGIVHSVNPSFYELFQLSPGEVIGRHWREIMPGGTTRWMDTRNADLLREGKISYYILPRDYALSQGKLVQTMMITSRIPKHPTQGPVKFIVTRWMELQNQDLSTPDSFESKPSSSDRPKTQNLWNWVTDQGKWIVGIPIAIGTAIGAALVTFFNGVK